MTNKKSKPKSIPQRSIAGINRNVVIARSIGERILSGEFPPGTALPNEAEWGKAYKASRTAIREALKTLTAKGLILSRPKIGARVEPRSNWNILDREVMEWHRTAADTAVFIAKTQEARRLFEPAIAELAATKRTPQQLLRLSAAKIAMEKAHTVSELIESDLEFHMAMIEAANNDLLVPFGIIIEKALATLFEFTTTRNPQFVDALQLHRIIVQKIRARDAPGAKQAMINLLADTDKLIKKPKP